MSSTPLAQTLAQVAALTPQQPAVWLGEQCYATFAQLAERVAHLAYGLRTQYGLQHGERVALVLKNCPQYLELLYAIWHAGLCAVPINAKLHAKEIDYILHDSGARLCITHLELALSVSVPTIQLASIDYQTLCHAQRLPIQAIDQQQPVWLFYTSGTTGKPKGVMLSTRNLNAMSWSYRHSVAHISPDDRLLHAAPMSHGSGLYSLPYLAAGAAQIIPRSAGFDSAELCELLQQHSQVCLFAAPTMLKRLVEHLQHTPADTNALKLVICGGAPLYRADLEPALACLGPKVAQIYGQGETPMTISAQSASEIAAAVAAEDHDYLNSVGRAQAGIELRIADAQDRALAAGEIGEVLVRGATVMQGYWQNPNASAITLRNGWLHTGDVGCIDTHGYLTLKDRSKDVIISGGSNIYPREVEEVLLMHPAIAEVAVLGRTHPDWGEEVVALLVAKPGVTLDIQALDAWCLAHIARFKRPKVYQVVAQLPKNSTGKLLKTALRELLIQGGDS